mmetsp:Transcript_135817/g.302322  ORF Transcript_135817/g.302322 Transcript_135817/m.302322 type:complete len:225 (+) Transcript_135817:62-736(+)
MPSGVRWPRAVKDVLRWVAIPGCALPAGAPPSNRNSKHNSERLAVTVARVDPAPRIRPLQRLWRPPPGAHGEPPMISGEVGGVAKVSCKEGAGHDGGVGVCGTTFVGETGNAGTGALLSSDAASAVGLEMTPPIGASWEAVAAASLPPCCKHELRDGCPLNAISRSKSTRVSANATAASNSGAATGFGNGKSMHVSGKVASSTSSSTCVSAMAMLSSSSATPSS